MLKTGSSGGIYIHPWDITDEGIDTCYDFLGEVCGLNELFVAAAYHAGTFILPHNPKRMVRWDDGGIYFRPQHPRWSATRIRPAVGEGVDTHGYMDRIVDRARARELARRTQDVAAARAAWVELQRVGPLRHPLNTTQFLNY